MAVERLTSTPRAAVAEVLAAGLGLVLLAGCVQRADAARLLAWPGLVLAALCLARAIRQTGGVRTLLGLRTGQRGRAAVAWIVAGAVLGALLAAWYRGASLGLTEWPLRLRGFAATAAAIGVVEELVYRGYAQGRLRPAGVFVAVLVAATLHTAYKCALFLPGGDSRGTSLLLLAAFTFPGGLLFGWLRERAGHVWPCLAAHAVFDVLVYGDVTSAPWWVWG